MGIKLVRWRSGAHSRGMNSNRTALERAFELARSGKYTSITDLKRDLSAEGYVAGQIEGFSLVRQLRQLMIAAQASQ